MTQTQICNLALAKLGQPAITSILEESDTAEQCRTHYDVVLEEILRAAEWPFAIRRASTAELATAPLFGWDKAFQKPEGSVQILEVNDLDPQLFEEPPFVIENNSILINDTACKVRYVYLETDPNKYPLDFVDAFALLLAARMAGSITGNIGLGQELENKLFNETLPRAEMQNVNESRPRRRRPELESDLLKSRYGISR